MPLAQNKQQSRALLRAPMWKQRGHRKTPVSSNNSTNTSSHATISEESGHDGKHSEIRIRSVTSTCMTHPVGTLVKKYFNGKGWVMGKVTKILPNGVYEVRFDAQDGCVDSKSIYSHSKVARLNKTASVRTGTKLAIYWPHEQRHYTAIITKEHPRKRENYLICYCHNTVEREWIDLNRHKFRVLVPSSPYNDCMVSKTIATDSVTDNDFVAKETDELKQPPKEVDCFEPNHTVEVNLLKKEDIAGEEVLVSMSTMEEITREISLDSKTSCEDTSKVTADLVESCATFDQQQAHLPLHLYQSDNYCAGEPFGEEPGIDRSKAFSSFVEERYYKENVVVIEENNLNMPQRRIESMTVERSVIDRQSVNNEARQLEPVCDRDETQDEIKLLTNNDENYLSRDNMMTETHADNSPTVHRVSSLDGSQTNDDILCSMNTDGNDDVIPSTQRSRTDSKDEEMNLRAFEALNSRSDDDKSEQDNEEAAFSDDVGHTPSSKVSDNDGDSAAPLNYDERCKDDKNDNLDEGDDVSVGKSFSLIDVGTRVEVYWPDDECYYAGVVMKKRSEKKPSKKPFFLKYDDDEREWIDFREHRFRILEATGGKKLITEEQPPIENVLESNSDTFTETLDKNDGNANGKTETVTSETVDIIKTIDLDMNQHQKDSESDDDSGTNEHKKIQATAIPIEIEENNTIKKDKLPEAVWSKDFELVEEKLSIRIDNNAAESSEVESPTVRRTSRSIHPTKFFAQELDPPLSMKLNSSDHSNSTARNVSSRETATGDNISLRRRSKSPKSEAIEDEKHRGSAGLTDSDSCANRKTNQSYDSDDDKDNAAITPSAKSLQKEKQVCDDPSQLQVGMKVAIWDTHLKQFSDGTITKERDKKAHFFVEFDDGESEGWINFKKVSFKVVKRGRGRPKKVVKIATEVNVEHKQDKALDKTRIEERKTKKAAETPSIKIKSSEVKQDEIREKTVVERYKVKKGVETSNIIIKSKTSKSGDSDDESLNNNELVRPNKTSKNSPLVPVEIKKEKAREGKSKKEEKKVKKTTEILNTKIKSTAAKPEDSDDESRHSNVTGGGSSKNGEDDAEKISKQTKALKGTDEISKIQIGTRVSVLWKEDDKYHDATVMRERSSKKPFLIEYDGGKFAQWIDFSKHNFKLLPPKPSSKKRGRPPTERSDDISKVRVGSHVAVWWEGDAKYIGGTVTKIRDRNKPFYIVYDDGEAAHWVDLESHRFKFLNDEDERCVSPPPSKRRHSDKGVEAEKVDNKKRFHSDTKDRKETAKHESKALQADVTSKTGVEPKAAKTNATSKIGVGSRIEIWWAGDAAYYAAVVEKVGSQGSRYFIRYDDDDEEWIDLAKNSFRLIQESTDKKKSKSKQSKSARSEESSDNDDDGSDTEGQQLSDGVLPDDGSDFVYGDVDKVKIGSRIAIWWTMDKVYYAGKVMKIGDGRKPFFIKYDDNDEEWTDLRKRYFRILDK